MTQLRILGNQNYCAFLPLVPITPALAYPETSGNFRRIREIKEGATASGRRFILLTSDLPCAPDLIELQGSDCMGCSFIESIFFLLSAVKSSFTLKHILIERLLSNKIFEFKVLGLGGFSKRLS